MEENTSTKKMLSGQVDAELFWSFKEAAASRQESMTQAIIRAAYLYIAAHKEEQSCQNNNS